MKRAKVKFECDSPYGDYRKGEMGYIDGYLRGGDNTPTVAIIKEDGRLVLAYIGSFQVTNLNELG